MITEGCGNSLDWEYVDGMESCVLGTNLRFSSNGVIVVMKADGMPGNIEHEVMAYQYDGGQISGVYCPED